MDILQLALDTRKLILVDISLSLIQRLVAHQHLVGPVMAVSHRRDPGSAPKRKGEEDDEADAAVEGAIPAQVASLCSVRGCMSCTVADRGTLVWEGTMRARRAYCRQQLPQAGQAGASPGPGTRPGCLATSSQARGLAASVPTTTWPSLLDSCSACPAG